GAASTAVAQQQRPAGTEWYRQAGDLAGQQVAQATPPTAPGQPAAAPTAAPPQETLAPPAATPAGGRPYRMPPIGSPYTGYGSTSGLYPSTEMNNYVVAAARAATARALFRQAESELGLSYRTAQRQFDSSADYKKAVRDERDAYTALNAARTKAFGSLDGDAKYQRLLALRQDLAERLQEGRASRTLGTDEVVAMATLKMSYATEMRALEVTALGNEPAVRDAQEKLVTAGTRVSELRQRFDESLRTSNEVLAARRNLEDARVARLTADAYLRATMVNGSYAVDYAYYVYRTPGGSGYNGNGNTGYGYGGYSNAGWNGYNRY
ncbi:MAG: hypothetical protein JWO31_2264, partial [Phycisphaerales bacterium]|nr:hypothetical protein [Phycisphaerales bacterium]